MPSSGPGINGTAADDASIGTVSWVLPTNAQTNDATFATVATNGISHYLTMKNPSGLSIPAGSHITGIQIDVSRKALFASDAIGNERRVQDSSVKIIKGGSISGTDLNQAVDFPTTEALQTFGGDGQLWGLSWVSTDFGATFGVAFAAEVDTLGGANTGSVNYSQATIFYTVAGGRRKAGPIQMG